MGEKKIRPNAVYITCLPDDVTEQKLIEVFGAIGVIKTNRKTGGPSVTLYNDKRTDKFKVSIIQGNPWNEGISLKGTVSVYKC